MRVSHLLLLILPVVFYSCNEVPAQKNDRIRHHFAGVYVDSADFPNRGMVEYDTMIIRNISPSYPDSFYIFHHFKIVNTFTTVSVKPMMVRDTTRIRYNPSCKCLDMGTFSPKIDTVQKVLQINKRKYKRIQ